jgi:hypothetical protein
MKFKFIECYGNLFIVIGIGYNSKFDPPDVVYCVPLEINIKQALLTNIAYLEIPLAQVVEITDKKRINAIWILYGS